jgi:hypothetical protein
MATLQHPRLAAANRLAEHIFQSYADLAARIMGLFRAKQISVAHVDPIAAERAARLFGQAQEEDSNLELDWLWYATNMTSSAHKRYCLRRALEINPDSEMARRALTQLASQEHR